MATKNDILSPQWQTLFEKSLSSNVNVRAYEKMSPCVCCAELDSNHSSCFLRRQRLVTYVRC